MALLGLGALLPPLRSDSVRWSLAVSAAVFGLWLAALMWRRARGSVCPGVLAGALAEWFERACARDSVEGCGWLALAHAQGRGAHAPDAAAAEDVRIRACALGDASTCLDQAARWIDGRGGARQPERAVTLLTEACDRDLAPACGVLGFLRAQGRTVPRDLAGARTAYDRACALGLPAACAQRAPLPSEP